MHEPARKLQDGKELPTPYGLGLGFRHVSTN